MHDVAVLDCLRHAAGQLRLAGQSLLLGVSGGADSVALLRGLRELCGPLRLNLHVAHLNHSLRGAAADADALWLEQLGRKLSVPTTIGVAAVGQVASETGRGIEETARDLRYEFLLQVAAEQHCPIVAVAHTADDQAETILHHVLRGTGLAGLGGMPAERALDDHRRLVRPLLAVRRSQVLSFLDRLGQDFREDASNADESYTRNRIRRRVLPDLAREFNPQLVDALLRLGRQAAEVQDVLSDCAADWLDRVLDLEQPRRAELKWQPLTGRPRHLVREVLAALWRRKNWPRQEMSFEHWDRLAGLLLEGGAADFPGGVAARRTGRVLELVWPTEA